MVEDKITLDKDVFKTLASGTRVDILKSLDTRRKTLSELSKQLGMSVSTVKEHLDNLVGVGLIEQKDDGHKWKYYDLTKKGKSILHPEDKKIWILLGISGIAFVGIAYDLMRSILYQPMFAASAPLAAIKESVDRAPEAGGVFIDPIIAAAPNLPYLHMLGLVIFGILIVSAFIYRRKKIREVTEKI